MDASTSSKLIEVGGNVAGDLVRLAFARSGRKKTESAASTEYPLQTEALRKLGDHTVVTLHDDGDVTVKSQGKLYVVTTGGTTFEQVGEVSRSATPGLATGPVAALARSLPTSEETTRELKRRLIKELGKAEDDLVHGLKIEDKPCDCLEYKHTLLLEGKAEELIPLDPSNSVYQDIIQWIKDNQPKVTIEAIQSGKYAAEYPYMAREFKNFRKRVMGSVGSSASIGSSVTLDQAKRLAADQACQAVERQWNSQEK